MSGQHKEIEFERELAEYLAAHGWLYSENDDLYDVDRALVPEDVFAWLQETQKGTFEKFIKPGSPDEAKRRRMLLDRLTARGPYAPCARVSTLPVWVPVPPSST